MVPGKEAKAASLVLTIVSVVLVLVSPDIARHGIGEGSTLLQRLSYPFFHANLLHAGLNCWVLLSLCFNRTVPGWMIPTAYLVSVTYPAGLFASLARHGVAVGLSGMIFAMVGMLTLTLRKPLPAIAYTMAFVLIGAVLPNIAWTLHLYCYAAGLMVGYIVIPNPWTGR